MLTSKLQCLKKTNKPSMKHVSPRGQGSFSADEQFDRCRHGTAKLKHGGPSDARHASSSSLPTPHPRAAFPIQIESPDPGAQPNHEPTGRTARTTGRTKGEHARGVERRGRGSGGRRRQGRGGQDVVGVRARAPDEGEGGGEDDGGPARHRAVAQGGPQGGAQLRAALPRGLLRRHPLPPRHQELPRPGRRPHRLRQRYDPPPS